MGEVGTAAEAVNALSDRFWNGIIDLSPITATVLGYEQGLDRLDDPGPEGRDKARALFRDTLAAADAIELRAAATTRLPTEERITLDIIRVICDIELEQQDQRIDRLKVVDQMDGPQTMLPHAGGLPGDRHAREVRAIPGPAGGLPALHGGQRRTGPRGPGRRVDCREHRHRARHRPGRTAAGASG